METNILKFEMASSSQTQRFEPGYGTFFTSFENTKLVWKSFQSDSLDEMQKMVKRLMGRQKLVCDYLIKVESVKPFLSELRLEVTFEYFPTNFAARKEQLRNSPELFITFASQLLFFWTFLKSHKLFLSSFSASSLRFDNDGTLKIIDDIEKDYFEDFWSIPIVRAKSLYIRMSKCPDSKSGLLAFLVGLIFLATFSSEREWVSLKQAIFSEEPELFEAHIARFAQLEEVQMITHLAGGRLFDETIYMPLMKVSSPSVLLKDMKANLASSTGLSAGLLTSPPFTKVKYATESASVVSPSKQEQYVAIRFPFPSAENSERKDTIMIQELGERYHTPFPTQTNHDSNSNPNPNPTLSSLIRGNDNVIPRENPLLLPLQTHILHSTLDNFVSQLPPKGENPANLVPIQNDVLQSTLDNFISQLPSKGTNVGNLCDIPLENSAPNFEFAEHKQSHSKSERHSLEDQPPTIQVNKLRKTQTELFKENIFCGSFCDVGASPRTSHESQVQPPSAIPLTSNEKILNTPNFKPSLTSNENSLDRETQNQMSFSNRTRNYLEQMKQVQTMNFDLMSERNDAPGDNLEESEVQKINFKRVKDIQLHDFLLDSLQIPNGSFHFTT